MINLICGPEGPWANPGCIPIGTWTITILMLGFVLGLFFWDWVKSKGKSKKKLSHKGTKTQRMDNG